MSIVTQLEAAEEELPAGSDAVRRRLDRARDVARENLNEARRLVAALRPEILEGASLPEALRRTTARWLEESGLHAEVTVTGEEAQLPLDLQVTLLRAAQEALANVRRHAAAGRVALTLTYMEDLVALDVRDDGRGFDPDGVPGAGGGGYGLRAMRERVERAGGQVLVESEPGEGTTLAVQLPLQDAASAPLPAEALGPR